MCVTHGENRFHEGKAKDRKNGRQGIRVCVSWSAWLKEILLANGINSTIKSVGRPATVCSVSRSCFSSTYKERKREFQRNGRFSKMARDSFMCMCVCVCVYGNEEFILECNENYQRNKKRYFNDHLQTLHFSNSVQSPATSTNLD